MPDWRQNRLTAQLGVDYPIIQGPLGGLASQRLVAGVSNFGGLGCFGALSLEPTGIRDVIDEIRALTSRPFAVNLWITMEDEGARQSSESDFRNALAPLLAYIDEIGAPRPAYKPFAPPPRFADQVRAVLDAKVPILSFVFSVPPSEILEECRARNIVTIGTATTPDEAIALEEAGIDVIVASGLEGGGHRGSFLRPAEESLIGTVSLVEQIVAVVKVPVIAAGGIGDARGVTDAFAAGAEGVQMGTAFLTFEESGATELHRHTLLEGNVETALTRGFTGRLARGIRNRLMDELSKPGTSLLPYPLQRQLTKSVTGPAESAGRADLVQMWAGQSANLARRTNLQTFLSSLVAELSGLQSAKES
ncbi:MAG: NAD(P)H-dependent flavin oxidoreductase [Gemmatimonadaceae bacterium]